MLDMFTSVSYIPNSIGKNPKSMVVVSRGSVHMAGSLFIGVVSSDMKSGVDASDGGDGADVSRGGGTGDIFVRLAL